MLMPPDFLAGLLDTLQQQEFYLVAISMSRVLKK